MTKPKAKGAVPTTAAGRRQAFVNAYIANGRNATQAAITAGYSPKTAGAAGSRLLTIVEIANQVAAAAEKAQAASELTTESVLTELRRIALSDSRKLFKPDGTLIPVHELDDETAAAVSRFEGGTAEKNGKVTVSTHSVRLYDKPRALEMAMRHLGLFEKDNRQLAPNMALQIVAVGPE